jgi:hypothetical protein
MDAEKKSIEEKLIGDMENIDKLMLLPSWRKHKKSAVSAASHPMATDAVLMYALSLSESPEYNQSLSEEQARRIYETVLDIQCAAMMNPMASAKVLHYAYDNVIIDMPDDNCIIELDPILLEKILMHPNVPYDVILDNMDFDEAKNHPKMSLESIVKALNTENERELLALEHFIEQDPILFLHISALKASGKVSKKDINSTALECPDEGV